jgi:uncharacterized protein
VKRVFVDSGGFYALLVPEDQLHERAAELFKRADTEPWQLVTTNAVVIETYSLLLVRTREARRRAVEFLDRLERTQCRVERIRLADEKHAIALVRAHEDKTYSLCDALSFMVMERLGIKDAIAFDRHFRQYGRFAIL